MEWLFGHNNHFFVSTAHSYINNGKFGHPDFFRYCGVFRYLAGYLSHPKKIILWKYSFNIPGYVYFSLNSIVKTRTHPFKKNFSLVWWRTFNFCLSNLISLIHAKSLIRDFILGNLSMNFGNKHKRLKWILPFSVKFWVKSGQKKNWVLDLASLAKKCYCRSNFHSKYNFS